MLNARFMAGKIPEVDLEQLEREHEETKALEGADMEASPAKKPQTSEDNQSTQSKRKLR